MEELEPSIRYCLHKIGKSNIQASELLHIGEMEGPALDLFKAKLEVCLLAFYFQVYLFIIFVQIFIYLIFKHCIYNVFMYEHHKLKNLTERDLSANKNLRLILVFTVYKNSILLLISVFPFLQSCFIVNKVIY